MNRTNPRIFLLVVLCLSPGSDSRAQSLRPSRPALSRRAGIVVTVVEGQLDREGPFKVRLALPPGSQLPPHPYGAARQLTILSGAIEFGMGDFLDRTKGNFLEAGAVVNLQPATSYVMRSRDGATVQLEGMGPWSLDWWNLTDASVAAPSPPLFASTEVGAKVDGAATVTVVSRAEIDRRNAYVAYDALDREPGLHVVRQLGLTGSGLSRLVIRGAGAVGVAGLQVFVDGRPDATVSFAHPTPSALGTETTDRVEVIHGPSPVLYGSGNTGVVNIITETPPPGASGFLKQSIREYGTAETQLRLSQGGERGFLRLSGAYRTTNGYLKGLDANVRNLSLKTGFKLNEVWKVNTEAALNEDHFSPLGPVSVPGPFTDPRTKALDLRQSVLDVSLTGRRERTSTSLKLYRDELDPRSQILDPGERRATISESGVRFRQEWTPSVSTRLTSGIDVLRVMVRNSPVLPPFSGPGLAIPRARVSASLTEAGIYAFAEQRLAPRLSGTGGIRLIRHSQYGFDTAEEASLLWRLSEDLPAGNRAGSAIGARYVRGYQSPTLQQFFGIFRGGIAGPSNPNLGPERVRQFEMNYLYTRGSWDLDLVGFLQKGTNGITAPANPPPSPPRINNSLTFRTPGVETRFRARAGDHVMIHAGIAVMHLDNSFLRAPRRTFDLGTTFSGDLRQPSDLVVHVTGRYAAGIVDTPVGGRARIPLRDYKTVDVNTSYRLTSHAEVFLALTNITNEAYQLVLGVPAPPRTLGGGVTLRF